jgi:hypothetical protein
MDSPTKLTCYKKNQYQHLLKIIFRLLLYSKNLSVIWYKFRAYVSLLKYRKINIRYLIHVVKFVKKYATNNKFIVLIHIYTTIH